MQKNKMRRTTFDPKQDRLSYGELLSPPPEFTLQKAVCTTYSLDLQTLVASTIALGLGEATDSELAKNPLNLLYALQKVIDKMLIFCDSSQIHSIEAKKRNRFLGLLEKSVVPVSLKSKDYRGFPSFHPKCWILQYRHVNDAKRFRYKFIVLSRNLTFDRSWDVSVCLDGVENNDSSVDLQTKRLIGFVDFLKKQIDANDSNVDSKCQFINELIDGLTNAKFKTFDRNFADFEILPIGTGAFDINKDQLFKTTDFDCITVMSPFVSKSVVERLMCGRDSYYDRKLVTRESELYKIKDLPRSFDVLCLQDHIVDGEEITSDLGDDYPKTEDIHAKIYFTQDSNGVNTLYLGSMNASENGINRNVELMLKLTCTNYSPFNFNAELDLEDAKKYFKEIDFDVLNFDELPPTPDEEFEKAVKTLCRLELSARVIDLDNGTYNVEISIPNYTDNGLNLRISPFFVKGIVVEISSFFVIEGLTFSQLSEFYVISNDKNERIIIIPTFDMPEGREQNIITSIISSKKKLSEYIAFVLGDDALTSFADEVLDIIEGEFTDGKNDKKASAADDMIPIYERMLKTSVTNPDRIKEIESIIQMIDDETIVTPEFKRLYETFKKTLQL